MPASATDRLAGLSTSVAVKPPCKVVSTAASLTLSGEQTIGVTAVVEDDRVLRAPTSAHVDAGIWIVSKNAWSRAKDFDGPRDVVQGTTILVAPGTAAEQFWIVKTSGQIVPGTTAVLIEQHTPEELALRADLADSGSTAEGDALVAMQRVATGAVARTLHAWVQDQPPVFEDFGAAGNGVADDTAECQAAIDAVSTLGGGVLCGTPGKTYRISAALVLKIGVRIDLRGSTVKQFTNNTPIFTAPTSVVTQKWALRGGILEFNTQQTSGDTSGIGVRLANGEVSYDWIIEDVQVNNACDGITCPATAGSFAFIGVLRNVTLFQCAGWGVNIDTLSGANTNITCQNVWVVQNAGAPIAGSKGFRFRNLSMARLDSIFADHIRGQFLTLEACTGSVGEATLESGVYAQTAPGQTILVTMSNSPMSVDSLKFVSCSLTTSGGGEIYMFRPTSAGVNLAIPVRDFQSTGMTYSGGTNIYEVAPAGPVRIYNEGAVLDRAVNLADFAVLKKIRRWNGVDQVRDEGGKYVLYGTTPPVSETWAVGDRLISTAIARATPVKEWACVVAGTPGTWLPTSWVVSRDTTANRPTASASLQGVTYLDTTLDADGRLVICNNTAWVDSTGAVV